MKVSVITVCFNSATTIRDTIESVIAQEYPDIEYIIVDGASTDSTMAIVDEYREHIDVLVSEPDRGIYDAMNKGIDRASGDVIATLNSDDFYTGPKVISRLLQGMERESVDIVFADLVIVDPEDTAHVIRYYKSGNFHPGRLRYGWMPAHPTLMVKRALYERLGNYSLDFRIAADFEMVVRLFHSERVKYAYVPIVAVTMRAGGISTAGLGSNWLLNREIVRACRKNGIRTSLLRVLLKVPFKLLEYLRKPDESHYRR